MEKILIIVTNAGLCNRLDEMLCYREYGLKNNYKYIYFHWTVNNHCECNIFDLIEHVKDVQIYPNQQNTEFDHALMCNAINHNKRRPPCKSGTFMFKGCDYEWTTIGCTGGRIPKYSEIDTSPLILKSNVVDIYTKKIQDLFKHEPYIAVHVRSDLNFILPLESYFEFIDRYPTHLIYVATDDVAYQEKFVEKYGAHRIFFNKEMTNHKTYNRNKSNINNILTIYQDIFICSKALDFFGNIHSSFARFIVSLRRVHLHDFFLKFRTLLDDKVTNQFLKNIPKNP